MMATNTERFQAIGDALLNAPAMASQLDRLGRALAYRDGLLDAYDAGTNAQKLQIAVGAERRLHLHLLKQLEGSESAGTARSAAEGQVAADFAEAQ